MIIVNLIGLALITLIIWWFWLYKPSKAVELGDDDITIEVNNGVYNPSRIKVAANKQITLNFFRKDASPCASSVLFPDFEISEDLPLEVMKSIVIPPMSAGEYAFHCQMKMYTGSLIVE